MSPRSFAQFGSSVALAPGADPGPWFRQPSRRPTSRGFTLLELILAMTVTCMLALSLYASLYTSFKARDNARAAVEPARAATLALDMIARDLECALPPPKTDATSVVIPLTLAGPFYGEPTGNGSAPADTVEFYCTGSGIEDPADPTRDDGIKRIDLALESLSDGSSALVRRVTRNVLSPEDLRSEGQVLCRNIASFQLRYFDGQTWTDTWDSTAEYDTLPVAVEVTLELARTGTTVGPAAPNPPGNYRLSRVVYLPCGIPLEVSSATTTQ